MKVTDFASFDKPTSSDLAHWKSLVVEGMDIASEPFHAATGRIALEDFYARVIVYPDATINIARLVTPGASPDPAPDAKPHRLPGAARRAKRCRCRSAASSWRAATWSSPICS
jgi:hypothetical protein